MLRFSIRQLLVATAVIAVGLIALLKASPFWSSAAMSGALVLLAASLLFITFRLGKQRAWWIGFGVFGWIYFVFCVAGDFVGYHSLLFRERLFTEQLTGLFHDTITSYYPPFDPFLPPVVGLMNTTSTATPAPPPFPIPPREDFIEVAHGLWTLLLAYSGGWLGYWVYVRQPTRG